MASASQIRDGHGRFSGQEMTVAQYFDLWSIPEPNSGCFLWLGVVDQDGYGRAYGLGRARKYIRAHRAVYRETFGSVPFARQVLHKCDVRSCVNPAHLFVGTNDDNVEDMMRKERQPRMRGERNGNAVLTDEIVREIKSAVGVSRETLGIRFGVSPAYIGRIRRGERWGHIT